MPEPIATWNSARGVWERPELNMLCGHAVPFSETWPTSFMTRGGRLYPLPTPGHRTDASGCSSSPGLLPTPAASQFNDGESLESWQERNERLRALGINGNGMGTPLSVAVRMLPTPNATDGNGGPRAVPEKRTSRGLDHGPRLRDVAPLLPTPQEFDSHFDSLNISEEAAERQLHRTDGIRRNTTGSLTKDLLLLKTPTAQLAVNGGSQHPDKRREGGHGPTLADQVECELLPTSAARDWKSGQSNLIGTNARPLNEVVEMLLPTPNATDWKGSGSTQGRERDGRPRPPGDADLPEAVALLPTPRCADGLISSNMQSNRDRVEGGARRRGTLEEEIALLPTPMAADADRQSPAMPRGNPTLIGALTSSPSADGSESSDGHLLLPLSPDEPARDLARLSWNGSWACLRAG